MTNTAKQLLGGFCGTTMSVVGTALQTSEVLQIISLVITIIGAIISMIVIPILNWYKQAKKDGKIDTDEIIEGAKTLGEGIENVADTLSKKGEKDD